MATIKLSAAKSAGAAISYAAGKDKLDEETRDWLRAHGVDETVVARLSDRAVAVGGENVDIEHVRGRCVPRVSCSTRTLAFRPTASFSRSRRLTSTPPSQPTGHAPTRLAWSWGA